MSEITVNPPIQHFHRTTVVSPGETAFIPSRITHGLMFVQECEDLRKENKFLANEIHMERIMMRTENELIMRNLRNLNQELQAEVKEVRAPDFCLVSSMKVCFYRLPRQKVVCSRLDLHL